MKAIQVSGLRKTYGDVSVVDGVSFEVEEGMIYGILGPNGAGKSTTVECVVGLRDRDGGSVEVMGEDPAANPLGVRNVVGVQLQASRLPSRLRVDEALDLYAAFYEDPASPDDLLERLGLTAQRRTAFDKLSGGQQQRLSIALALIGRPRIAILDELTTGLDPQARRDTWRLIEELRDDGLTIVLVTHFMDEAERLCDRVAVMRAGRVVADDRPRALAEAVPVADRAVPDRPTLEDAFLSLTSAAPGSDGGALIAHHAEPIRTA
jgi:ABC-2 type transport system ATP-binding protein